MNIKRSDNRSPRREPTGVTGETLTTAIATALCERRERIRGRSAGRDLDAQLNGIALRCATLPVLDDRPWDETTDLVAA